MTQAVFFIDGRACPLYVCDICGLSITEPRMAMVAWSEPIKESPKHIFTKHVHKGACLDKFEAALPAGEELMTVELIHNLRMLIDNTFLKDKEGLDFLEGDFFRNEQ